MEMLADVKQTLLEDRKRSGGPERLYRRWPFSWPREEKRWWGIGSGQAGHRPKRAEPGRQLPRPIIPDLSRSSEVHFPSVTAYHQFGPACRPIEGEPLQHDCSLEMPKA